MVIFHSYVTVYQRVNNLRPSAFRTWPIFPKVRNASGEVELTSASKKGRTTSLPSCSYWIQVVPISGLTRLTKAGLWRAVSQWFKLKNWSDLIRLLSNVTRCHKMSQVKEWIHLWSILCPASAWAFAEDGLMEHGHGSVLQLRCWLWKAKVGMCAFKSWDLTKLYKTPKHI